MFAVIDTDDAEPVELNVSPEKYCDVIAKAREFDLKVEPVEREPEAGSIDMGTRTCWKITLATRR